MKTTQIVSLTAAAAALGWVMMTPASAAPPTVTPTPGYDARLQEQHAALNRQAPAYHQFVRHGWPVHRRHVRRIHHGY